MRFELNNLKHTVLFLISYLFLTSCLVSQPALSLENNSYTYVKSNLEFLTSDLLEGRETASRGEKLAALFISEELEKYGVLPFGDNGTYFQDFPLEVRGFNKNTQLSFIDEGGNIETYINGENILFNTRSLPSDKYKNNEYEIIFAGYGIFSEADNYNSYENVDAEGKVVLILNGTPKLNGEEILADSIVRKYRWSSSKTETAIANGAVGVLVLPDSRLLRYWSYYQGMVNSMNYNLKEENSLDNSDLTIPSVVIDENLSRSLFKNEILDYESFNDFIEPNPSSFLLKTKVKFEYDVIQEERTARNIIGLIKGNNQNLSSEYLTIGAHYDHEGIKNGQIYNGADDNGSGTVTVLEVARRLALKKENERPIIVIFHTGEEKGLLGAKYLTNNSDFVDDAIVHINVDMVGRESEDSIYCIGASRISKELGEIVESVNAETTNFLLDYTFDDPNDRQRLYYRSDHVHYANKGIPIAFFYDYMNSDYHKPTDTVEKINFAKIVKMGDLVYGIIQKVSNLDHKLSTNE